MAADRTWSGSLIIFFIIIKNKIRKQKAEKGF